MNIDGLSFTNNQRGRRDPGQTKINQILDNQNGLQ